MRPIRAAVPILGLAAIVAATSCRPPRPCAAAPSTTVAPAPRRDHCLAPPWVLDPARPESGVAGWSAAVCADGPGWFPDAADRARRSAYFIHDGTRTISEPEITAVAEAMRPIGVSSGLGGCCSPKVAKETQVSCLKFWPADVCRLPMSPESYRRSTRRCGGRGSKTCASASTSCSRARSVPAARRPNPRVARSRREIGNGRRASLRRSRSVAWRDAFASSNPTR